MLLEMTADLDDRLPAGTIYGDHWLMHWQCTY